MRKLIIALALALMITLSTPVTTQSSDRVKACLSFDCGTLGDSLCSLAWWPGEDGKVIWYWCVMIEVVGKPVPKKI